MEKKIDVVTGSNHQGDRKPYHSPSRITVLGGIEAVVQSSVYPGSDGNDISSGS